MCTLDPHRHEFLSSIGHTVPFWSLFPDAVVPDRPKPLDPPRIRGFLEAPDRPERGTSLAILTHVVGGVCKKTGLERPLQDSSKTIHGMEATVRKIYFLGLLYVGLSLVYLMRAPNSGAISDGPPFTVTVNVGGEPGTDPADAPSWFRSMKAYCNPVEVETQLTWNPAPQSTDGIAYEAACYALAGRIDSARERILRVPEDQRWKAAGVVFNVGHPVADAGDDRAAGPIMELVVDFWPNHYMALYHAGAARYALGDHGFAHKYLVSFLGYYDTDDGWRRSASSMIAEIEAR